MTEILDLALEELLGAQKPIADFLVDAGVPGQHAEWIRDEFTRRLYEAANSSVGNLLALITQTSDLPILRNLAWEVLYLVLQLSRYRAGDFALTASTSAKNLRKSLRLIQGGRADERAGVG